VLGLHHFYAISGLEPNFKRVLSCVREDQVFDDYRLGNSFVVLWKKDRKLGMAENSAYFAIVMDNQDLTRKGALPCAGQEQVNV
jgi:hypothetical protein